MSAQKYHDVVDDFLQPYVAAVGSLVINYAKSEASLLELITSISGMEVGDAYDLLFKGEISGRMSDVSKLVLDSRLEASDKKDLEISLKRFWDSREYRHRLIHDEFAPGWDEEKGLIVLLYGRSHKNPNKTLFNELDIDDIWQAAICFQTCYMLFEHYTYCYKQNLAN